MTLEYLSRIFDLVNGNPKPALLLFGEVSPARPSDRSLGQVTYLKVEERSPQRGEGTDREEKALTKGKC